MLDNSELAAALQRSMYGGEPCRICGGEQLPEDSESQVFAGYSSCNTTRTAHKQCWQSQGHDKSSWAYPND
jgi:hypothetical protein